jgi:hypothetical protein
MPVIETPEEARQALVESRAGVKRLLQDYPGEDFLESVANQLRYLQDLMEGRAVDPAKKKDLNFGFLGVRHVVEFDEAVGKRLADLGDYVERKM